MADIEPTRYRIALVDDEPRIHAMIRDVLEQAGLVAGFESFYDPFSFIQYVKQHPDLTPDLVQLDVHFANSGLSGIECIPFVREDHPYLPIILLTGMEDSDIEKAQDYECVYYIPKPVRPEHLVRMVRFYLSAGRKSGRRVAELRDDLEEQKRRVQTLSTELAKIEIDSWDSDRQSASPAEPRAFQRILDILHSLLSTTELAQSIIADLEELFAKDFQVFKKTVETIVRFDGTDTPPPGMRVHRFHAVPDVYSLSITKKARLLYTLAPGTRIKRMLRLDPEHNDRAMEKWLKEYR